MVSDVLVVLLPDGELHYARPGHVNTLCGENRISNNDVAASSPTETIEAGCPACRLLSGRHEARERSDFEAAELDPETL